MIARSMRSDDIDQVLGLLTEQRRVGGRGVERAGLEEALLLLLRRPDLGAVFVLDEGGRLLGATVVTIGFSLEVGGRAMVVNALCADPTHRDPGLGRMLIDRVLTFARRAECRAVVLEPALDDHETCRWYDDLGFEHRHREYCSASLDELTTRLRVA
jgi:ribosomal protein S18 acetylase RimI-like enzyme